MASDAEHPPRHGRAYVEAAIRTRAFSLVYQPIVELDTGALAGVEALCRFHDGRPPDLWFAQTEEMGLSRAMDLAIIGLAIDNLDALPDGYLSLNLSLATLAAGAQLTKLLAPALDRRPVVLELSERAVVDDYDLVEEQLAPVRDAGVLLAVDDAGAGSSSPGHIAMLRPDVLKLDRSLIEGIDTDRANSALAAAAVRCAGELGATVVAEGVETDGELDAVRAAGIHAAQGYLLGRPERLPLPPVTYTPRRVLDLVAEDARPVPGRLQQLHEAAAVIRQATQRLETADDPATRRALCSSIDRQVTTLLAAIAALAESGMQDRSVG